MQKGPHQQTDKCRRRSRARRRGRGTMGSAWTRGGWPCWRALCPPRPPRPYSGTTPARRDDPCSCERRHAVHIRY